MTNTNLDLKIIEEEIKPSFDRAIHSLQTISNLFNFYLDRCDEDRAAIDDEDVIHNVSSGKFYLARATYSNSPDGEPVKSITLTEFDLDDGINQALDELGPAGDPNKCPTMT